MATRPKNRRAQSINLIGQIATPDLGRGARRHDPSPVRPAAIPRPAVEAGKKPATPPAAPPTRCIACGVAPRCSLRLSNGKSLLRCPKCLLGWWNWPAFDPSEFYDQSYFQSAQAAKGYNDYRSLEAGIRRTSRARLGRISKLYSPLTGRPGVPRFLLDVGCGHGYFLDEARAAGWRTHGLEVSPYAASQARKRGLAVQCGPIEHMTLAPAGRTPVLSELPTGVFDCVTLWDVIEHLRDPAGTLQTLAGSLRRGGVMALSTGDITSLCARMSGRKWHLFNLPEHLFFFSPQCLQALLRRAGCEVLTVRRELTWFSADYLVERLGKTLLGNGAGSAERAGGMSRLLGLVRERLKGVTVPANLFDIVSIYAVKV